MEGAFVQTDAAFGEVTVLFVEGTSIAPSPWCLNESKDRPTHHCFSQGESASDLGQKSETLVVHRVDISGTTDQTSKSVSACLPTFHCLSILFSQCQVDCSVLCLPLQATAVNTRFCELCRLSLQDLRRAVPPREPDSAPQPQGARHDAAHRRALPAVLAAHVPLPG